MCYHLMCQSHYLHNLLLFKGIQVFRVYTLFFLTVSNMRLLYHDISNVIFHSILRHVNDSI
jgi:hypothetical protein